MTYESVMNNTRVCFFVCQVDTLRGVSANHVIIEEAGFIRQKAFASIISPLLTVMLSVSVFF